MLPVTHLFLQVVNLDPNNGFAKSHLGFIIKTDHLRYNEAIPLLREGITSGEAGADDGRFYFHLGDAFTRIGKPDEVNFHNNNNYLLLHIMFVLQTAVIGKYAIIILNIGTIHTNPSTKPVSLMYNSQK